MKAFRDEAVAKVAAASGLPVEAVDRALEVPDAERGDFAFPCFPLAKERRAPPPKIAAEIAAEIVSRTAPGGRIARAEAVGPYVNLFADRAQHLGTALQLADDLCPVDIGGVPVASHVLPSVRRGSAAPIPVRAPSASSVAGS